MDLLYPLSGFLVGLIVGLTGVGGGSLMTPLLILVFGVAPASAVGTDLLYASITKAGGTVAHTWHRNVDWRVVALLGVGSLPAAALTVAWLGRFQIQSEFLETVISSTLALALLLTALALIFRARIQRYAEQRAARTTLPLKQRTRAAVTATVITGVVLGVLVSITSVGAGALGTVALTFLYPRLRAREIVGTDIAHAVPLTLVAGLGHAALGTVDYALLGSLLIGSLPGIWIGSNMSARLPERHVRSALALVLIAVSSRLFW